MADSLIHAGAARRKGWRARMRDFVPVVLYFFASVLIGRATMNQGFDYHRLPDYIAGDAPMPFQARYMMSPVLRWAIKSPAVARYAKTLEDTTRGPEDTTMQVVDSVCMLLLGWLLVRMRRACRPGVLIPWLAPAVLLWVVGCTFVLHYEQQITMPYDFPAMAFFAAGLVACLERRPLVFLAIVAAATYNRETSVFLVPIWVACAWEDGSARALAVGGVGVAEWMLVRAQIYRWIHVSRGAWSLPWWHNAKLLEYPQHWAQLACVGGFLLLPMWLARGLIQDRRLRGAWIGGGMLAASALVFGFWNETRIFGELSPLIACTAAVQFEAWVLQMRSDRSLLQQRQ